MVSPSAPGARFGRNELIEKVIGLAENLEPIALVGPGGIGKTSIALTVLHHERIKARFGENRRFIRCDQFPASRANFLARLSEVISVRVKDPEDLTPLRPFLSSREMLIILDNAESILGPQGTNAEEIYSVVDELCQFKTTCLLITSSIAKVPQRCKSPEIPTLSMEAASDIFYHIHGDEGRPDIINHLLRRLDFHPLSITLLATTASHNAWGYNRLVEEWETRWAQVSRTGRGGGLAATIELSIASPEFQKLGPDAHELLKVVAFLPQGIDYRNFDWLLPTVSNTNNIFDEFTALSLTYWNDPFFTMLASVRDYLSPQDPQSLPLLCTARDRYFSQLSMVADPYEPGFRGAEWLWWEDMNVEHLLHFFISINSSREDIWATCIHFMRHLCWYKPRQTTLRSEIEALPDDHHSKSKCLSELSRLFGRLRNHAEQTKLLVRTLELERRRGDDIHAAQTLLHLSDVNRLLGFHEEGIRQARESLAILERIGDTKGQLQCWNQLARLFFDDKQLDAAEEAASHAMDLTTEKGREVLVCQLHRIFGQIHQSKGEKEKAIDNFETALGIASPPDWDEELFWIHLSLAELFGNEDELDDANTHIEKAKSHAANDEYKLGRAMDVQANVWCLELRLEDAKSEVLCAIECYERCRALDDAGVCRELLQVIERAMNIYPGDFQGEFLD